MKKRLFILIMGIIMFIPIAHAKDITKEEFVNNLQKYVEEFNSISPTYEEYPYGSGIKKNMEQIILTNDDENISLKSGDYETNIVFNETEQTVSGVSMSISQINENSTDSEKKLYYENTMYRYIQMEMIGLSIIDSKGIDKELGISVYDVYNLRTGSDKLLRDYSSNFYINLSYVRVIDDDGYNYLVPKLSIEKISETKLRIFFHLERFDEERFNWDEVPIDLLIFENPATLYTDTLFNKLEFKLGNKDGEYIDIDIEPDKEYMFKGVVYHPTLLGYLRLSEPVYYNRQSQQDGQTNNGQENQSATTNTDTKDPSKTTSNTTENPKTGIKNYTIVGLITMLVLALTYKLYKNRINN